MGTEEKMKLGEKIGQIRYDRGITQIFMARAIEVSKSYLSHIETGKTMPSYGVLNKIAKFFGITIEELLDNVYIEKYGYKWLIK